MSYRAIFLDRDGVINKVIYRNGAPGSPRDLGEFEFEAAVPETLQRLCAAGFKLFVVSNQPDVARGLVAPEGVRKMTELITATLAIEGVKVCPHDDRDRCECRKPKPGMLLELSREHSLALHESFFIGDTRKDTLAARAAGCPAIIIDRPYNQGDPADYRVASLSEAADLILGKL